MPDTAVLPASDAGIAEAPAQEIVPDQLVATQPDQSVEQEATDQVAADTPDIESVLGQLSDEQLREAKKANPRLKAVVDEEVASRVEEAKRGVREAADRETERRQTEALIEQQRRWADSQTASRIYGDLQATLKAAMENGEEPDGKKLGEIATNAARHSAASLQYQLDNSLGQFIPAGTQVRSDLMQAVTKARATGDPLRLAVALSEARAWQAGSEGYAAGYKAAEAALAAQTGTDATAEAERTKRQAAQGAPQPTAISGAPVGKPDYDRVLTDPTKSQAERDKAFEAKHGFKL